MRATTQRHLAFIDAHLAGTPYFAGPDFTAADIMMVFPFGTVQHFRKLDLSPFPAIQAYMQRIEARPAYQRAMVKAGPGVKAA